MRAPRAVAAHKRHKKILKKAKGFRAGRKNIFKQAENAVMKAGIYAYRDRRRKKRDFRSLWITRINAACRAEGLMYSRFIKGMDELGIQLDRKILADLAVNQKAVFAKIVAEVNGGQN